MSTRPVSTKLSQPPSARDMTMAPETMAAFARFPVRYPRKSAAPMRARLPMRYASRTGRHVDGPETWTTNSSPARVTVRSRSISPVSRPLGRVICRTPIRPVASAQAIIVHRGTAAVHTATRMNSTKAPSRLRTPNTLKTSTYSSTVEERCRRTVASVPAAETRANAPNDTISASKRRRRAPISRKMNAIPAQAPAANP